MAEQIDDGGPAFPRTGFYSDDGPFDHDSTPSPGMSLRVYAAIKLRVPDSGIDWLDRMIDRAKLDEFAGQALAGLLASDDRMPCDMNRPIEPQLQEMAETYAATSVRYADATLAALRGGE